MNFKLEEKYVKVNGANFHYYRTQSKYSPSKPTLVLQHGSTDNGLCWKPVARELAGVYDIIMPDARGHGRSSRLSSGESLDQVADLASLLTVLGVRQVILAGHSMGAQIASGLTARHCGLVCAVILEDPPWLVPGPDTMQDVQNSNDDSAFRHWKGVQDQSLQEIIEHCHADHPSWPDSYVLPWCRGKKEWDLNFLRMALLRGVDWQEELSCIVCPVLLITADPSHGGIVTPEVEMIAAKLNSKVQIARFPGVGHHVRFAAHTAYMRCIRSFLEHI